MNHNKRRLIVHLVAACLVMQITACTKKPAHLEVKTLQELEQETFQNYTGTNIQAAEKSLLLYRDTVREFQTNQVKGPDYNFLLWATAARLNKLYELKGDQLMANEYLKECATLRPIGTGFADQKVAIDDFVKKLDGDRIGWKQQNQKP